MKGILEELYSGRIYPDEQIISKDPEYCIVSRKLSEKMEAWKKKLTGDDFVQLEALLDIQKEISRMEALASFMYGFKLGAMIMLEVADEIAGSD